jgi:hypothetical protein
MVHWALLTSHGAMPITDEAVCKAWIMLHGSSIAGNLMSDTAI